MGKSVLTIFGTRSEAIKLAPVIQEMGKHHQLDPVVCCTGEHRQLLDQVLQLFEIEPAWDLNLMKPGGSLEALTADILLGLRQVFREVQPDIILLAGGTVSSASAALSSYYNKVTIVYIDADSFVGGERLFWPDQGTRNVVEALSSYHLVPTETARDMLLDRGVPEEKIRITGNPGLDSLQQVESMLREGSKVGDTMQLLYPELDQIRGMITFTCNHVDGFPNGYDGICNLLGMLSEHFPEVDFVYPALIEENSFSRVSRVLSSFSNVYLKKPQDYLPFVYLMQRSHLIITDSTGIMAEGPVMGKPVLALGAQPQVADTGNLSFVGYEPAPIVEAVKAFIADPESYASVSVSAEAAREKSAARQIAEVLSDIPC